MDSLEIYDLLFTVALTSSLHFKDKVHKGFFRGDVLLL